MVDGLADALVVFSVRARRDLCRIDPSNRTRIVDGTEPYAETGAGDVKRMQTQTGLRLRAGEWRVLFTQPYKKVVEIDVILDGRDAYRRR